ncbi:MAG: hypothetical protein RMY28_016045 [Nostoc sp. ChiSLP01]|nr:hypothetical protein [Nostoc sp. CmiSLP01]MDZ8288960.1 hypothetical protein [Nostoc sp. ChiSLP01]
MKSQETQNTKIENKPEHLNVQGTGKSEPITQVQKNNVLTNRDLPNPLTRYGFTLVILATLLFVVAIYYGIINP